MQSIISFASAILHLDRYLGDIITRFGSWTYVILFAIVFLETGIVVTPLLPGDSLLFAAGTLAGANFLDVRLLFIIFTAAAIIGDTVNYHVGYFLGPKVFRAANARFFKKEYLERTQAFYKKYGGKTIILARFVPIIRTFAPFVAGVAKMNYLQFLSYNVIGGLLWVSLLLFAGYFFGNLRFVQENFSFVILAIIIVSILPAVFEYVKQKRRRT